MMKNHTFVKLFNVSLLLFFFIFSSISFSQLAGGNSYPINGTENPPTSFASITSAVSYITTNGVNGTGQVMLELNTGYLGETGPVTIGIIPGASLTLGVTIRPAAGYTAVTTIAGLASPNQFAIALNGCQFVTLDGRSGGVGSNRDWTISCTGSTNGQSAIRFLNTPGSTSNNTIKFCNLIAEATGTTSAIVAITTGTTPNLYQNNTIEYNLIESGATIRGYAVSFGYSVTGQLHTGNLLRHNIIRKFNDNGIRITGTVPGLEVYGNEIYFTAAQTSSTSLTGIHFGSTSSNTAGGVKIHSNKIYDLITTTTGVTIRGFYQFSSAFTGEPVRFYNNFIALGKDLTSNPIIYGIDINTSATGTPTHILYNSVFISGSSSATANNSMAFRRSLADLMIDVRNNSFYNTRSNTGGTGTHWAIGLSSAVVGTINNNNYFADGTGGVLGTTTNLAAGNQTTIAGWKSVVTVDNNSVSQTPNYVAPLSTPPDLKINTSIATQLESGGVPIVGISNDIDGDLRHSSFPDIGADEFAGIPLDLTPPAISYTLLNNSGSLAGRTLTATITDVSGVVTGTNGPRLYYKKKNDVSFIIDDTPVVNVNNYTFTLNYTLLGGVAVDDTIQYYVAAQDLNNNIGTNPSGGSGINPPGTVAPSTPNFFRIIGAPLSGDYTVGVTEFGRTISKNFELIKSTRRVLKEVEVSQNQNNVIKDGSIESNEVHSFKPQNTTMQEVEEEFFNIVADGKVYNGPLHFDSKENEAFRFTEGIEGVYTSLAAAIADLNLRGVSGNVRFLLTDTLYSTTGTYNILVSSDDKPGLNKSVTIKPNTGITTTITSNSTTPVFIIYEKYVTIDGSNTVGGTTRNMTISNTGTATTSGVAFVQPSTNITFKNIIGFANASATSYGIIFNNVLNGLVDNCEIRKVTTGIGLQTSCDSIVIKNNLIGSSITTEKVQNVGISVLSSTNYTITNNIISGLTRPSTGSTAGMVIGLQSGGINPINGLVTNNIITSIRHTGAGANAYAAFGMRLSSPSTTSNILVANNMISDILGDGDAGVIYNPHGIYIEQGGGYNIYYNSINLFGNINYSGTTAASAGAITVNPATSVNIDLRNNIFSNAQTFTSTIGRTYAIYSVSPNTAFNLINHNDYVSLGVSAGFGFLGTTAIADLTAWQTASLQDANSISEIAPFVDSTNLHIPNGSLTRLEGTATPIAGITIDIDGQTRNTTKPDIGADEFAGSNPDNILAGDYFIPKGTNPKGFTTLADAFTALNTYGVSAAVRFLIDDNLAEIGANLLITRNDLTDVNSLTIKPAVGKTPIITITGATATSGATQFSGIALSGASYVTFDGSNTVSGTSRDLTIAMNDSVNGRIGITLFGNSDFIVVKNLNIKYNIINATSMTGRGIYANGQASGVVDSLIVENCQIGDLSFAPAYAISITGSSGSLFYASKIHIRNNELFGIMRALYFFYGGLGGTVSEIHNNIIHSPYAPTTANVVWGILFNNYNGTINIYNNTLNRLISNDTGTSGIYGIGTLSGQSGVILNIYNNFLGGDFQHTGTGTPSGIDVISFQDNIPQANVYHNTIVLNNMTKTASSRMTGVRWGGTANVDIKNNIIVNDKDAAVAFALYSASGTFVSNYNDLFVSGALANIGFSGVARKTFQTWKDSTGQDANSHNVSVPFVSALNFHIPDGTVTPIKSAGTPIAWITTDIDGDARNATNPDIGADEFIGNQLIAAPSNLIAVADTHFVTLTWTDNSNNEIGFAIERKDGDTSSVNPWVAIDSVSANTPTYIDSAVTPLTTYVYRVYAYNATGVSGFSNFEQTTTIIPVELTSFAAMTIDRSVKISWSTATETNNRGFEVQRLMDNNWSKIGFIEGKGTTTEKSDYTITDKFDYQSYKGTISYRLKQFDYDGTFSYSNVILVDIDFTPTEYTLYQNYPNPFNPSTTIKFALPQNSFVKVSIFNLLGEQISVLVDEIKEAGYHNILWNASNMPSGFYIYTIETKSQETNKEFKAVKKMMLVK